MTGPVSVRQNFRERKVYQTLAPSQINLTPNTQCLKYCPIECYIFKQSGTRYIRSYIIAIAERHALLWLCLSLCGQKQHFLQEVIIIGKMHLLILIKINWDQKHKADRHCLEKISSAVHNLARQGFAVQAHVWSEGNLAQFFFSFFFQAIEDPALAKVWSIALWLMAPKILLERNRCPFA